MVPELPLRQPLFDRATPADAAHEPVEKRIEIVIEDERASVGTAVGVVPLELPHHLQLEGRLPGALLPEHDPGAGVGRVAVLSVPRRMKRRLQARPLEDGAELLLVLAPTVARDAVVLEEFLDLHAAYFAATSLSSSSETRQHASPPWRTVRKNLRK